MKLANIAANAELYEKLGKFVDRAKEFQVKVESLEAECKELREQLRFKGQFVRVGGMVYVDGDEEPLCSHCADVHNLPVHLTLQHLKDIGKTAMCPKCKNQAGQGLTSRSRMEQAIRRNEA